MFTTVCRSLDIITNISVIFLRDNSALFYNSLYITHQIMCLYFNIM